jgi:hypothetical protein
MDDCKPRDGKIALRYRESRNVVSVGKRLKDAEA